MLSQQKGRKIRFTPLEKRKQIAFSQGFFSVWATCMGDSIFFLVHRPDWPLVLSCGWVRRAIGNLLYINPAQGKEAYWKSKDSERKGRTAVPIKHCMPCSVELAEDIRRSWFQALYDNFSVVSITLKRVDTKSGEELLQLSGDYAHGTLVQLYRRKEGEKISHKTHLTQVVCARCMQQAVVRIWLHICWK